MTDQRCPVEDWATDYDLFDAEYLRNPYPVWDDLRQRCPIAHTERWGGSWMATRYADLQQMVRMVPELSSKSPIVVPLPPDMLEEAIAEIKEHGITESPPITADPPVHRPFKSMVMRFFTPDAVDSYREYTESLCNGLIDQFIERGEADAAVEYAQQIPPRVIGTLLGIDSSRADEFTQWVQGALEVGQTNPEVRRRSRANIRNYFTEIMADRRQRPRDDLMSRLIAAEINGEPLSDHMIIGVSQLLLVAGIDTTWSSIGAALWHFAGHPEHRRQLAGDPALFPTAIEEMLRFYSPVMMARKATTELNLGDVTINPDDRVILNFPSANRDPEAFERADEVVLDREQNRHLAFGLGIHRCAGSNLARMEMDVALRVWFARLPEFELSDPDAVTWSGGQVRGPRSIPIRFPVG